MIKINGKEPSLIYIGDRAIVSVYTLGLLVWPETIPDTPDIPDVILSCYYNGYWIDEYPWTDDTSWTD